LNGFFAGFLELGGAGITALSPEANAVLMSGLMPAANGPLDDGDDGQAPWHDQTLPLAERMKLADGRPLRRRMMAAMGQQDCGQGGYNCEDYSEIIFLRKGERLNVCGAGGEAHGGQLKSFQKGPKGGPPPRGRRPGFISGPTHRAPPRRSRAARRAWPLARPSSGRGVSLTHAVEQAGLGEGDVASRVRC